MMQPRLASAVVLLVAAFIQPPAVLEWSDTSGRFKTRGSLDRVESAEVVLRVGDQMVRVPVHRLSQADRQHLVDGGHIPKTFQVLVGKVIGVSDGDTLTVLDAKRQSYKIRLAGIDTPEIGQPFGQKAKSAMSKLAFGKQVQVSWSERDKYSRVLGHIYVGKTWVNKELVRQGVAWHYKKYSTDRGLAADELSAKRKKLGLWQDPRSVPPWDWRRLSEDQRVARVTGVSPTSTKQRENPKTQPATAAKHWLNTSSSVRHNASCKYFAKTKRGRYCSATDGKPCGICGG